MIKSLKEFVIIGGGAAGMFAALAAKAGIPLLKSLCLKKVLFYSPRCASREEGDVMSLRLLDPKELVRHYPRGHKELLGLSTVFSPKIPSTGLRREASR